MLMQEPETTLYLLTPLLPVGIACYVLDAVFSAQEINGYVPFDSGGTGYILKWPVSPPPFEKVALAKTKKVSRILRQIGQILGKGIFLPATGGYPRKLAGGKPFTGAVAGRLYYNAGVLRQALRGRILYLEEIQKSLAENRLSLNGLEAAAGNQTVPDFNYDLLCALQVLALQGEIEIKPSFGFVGPGEATCFRCGQKVVLRGVFNPKPAAAGQVYQAQCPVCRFPSLYCERCNTMGESRLCRALFALGADKPLRDAGYSQRDAGYCLRDVGYNVRDVSYGPRISLTGVPPLTAAQKRASQQLADFVHSRQGSEILLWAVCGAGKTEVVLKAIAAVLEDGGRVLYAIPRRDVVKELLPRLKYYFSGVEVTPNFGGSPEKYRRSSVVIATTHQVLRYYRGFDMVILDEADAYPYRDNDMLHMAVKRAVKPQGRIVYLTATPDRSNLAGVRQGTTKLITIPARHHGHPVPEPQIKTVNSFHHEKGGCTIDPFVQKLLDRWLAQTLGQVFVFLPTVSMVERYGPVMAEFCDRKMPGMLRYSHARDSLRDEKTEAFKAGRFRILVTTTIMERGITVPQAHVLVLEADFQSVFDEGTLIQMAGRAGRSTEHPDGEVWFLGSAVTADMKTAREKICYLNTLARRAGYLRHGG